MKILGVFNHEEYEFIHIKGYFYNEEDHEPCVLLVERDQFQETLNNYLDSKKDFCTRYDHYCGVHGFISVEDCIEIDKINLLVDTVEKDDDWELVYKDVRAFIVTEFDVNIDMEHG